MNFHLLLIEADHCISLVTCDFPAIGCHACELTPNSGPQRPSMQLNRSSSEIMLRHRSIPRTPLAHSFVLERFSSQHASLQQQQQTSPP